MRELPNSTDAAHATQIPAHKKSSVFVMFLQISEFGGVLLSLSCIVFIFVFVLKRWFPKWSFTIRYAAHLEILIFVLMWYGISVCFGLFNKLIFSETSLNFPLLFSSCHMLFKGILVLLISPILKCCCKRHGANEGVDDNFSFSVNFPSTKMFLLYITPIGVCTGADIGLTNLAVTYGQLSQVTVIKNLGIVAVLFYSIIFGLQPCKIQLGIYVFMISFGAVLALWNNPKFNMTCIVLTFTAIMFGAVRWTVTQYALQREKISILRLMLFLSPSAFLTTFLAGILIEKDRLVEHYNASGSTNASPGTSHKLVFIEEFFLVGLGGGVLSLLLLLVEFKIIGATSALATDVLAKIKDLLLILMAVVIYDDKLSVTNIFGCIFIFAGIFLFAKFKNKQHLTSPNQSNERYEIVSNEDVFEDEEHTDSDVEIIPEKLDKGTGLSHGNLSKSPKMEIQLVDRFAAI